MRPRQAIRVRRYQPGDRDRVMLLRPRLTEGTAAWRDPAGTLRAVEVAVRSALDAFRVPGHVTLETGAANQPARSPYQALGYEKEDIWLTRHPLTRKGP